MHHIPLCLVMSDTSLEILYDHYKETHSIISEAIKRRDRLMLFVVLTLGFFAFQAVYPTDSDGVINQFLNFKFGLTYQFDLSKIETVIWFLLLIFTLRYFQVAVFIERQYKYIHRLEEDMNKKFREELITREGKSYLHRYPRYTDWIWMLYTVIFPVLLFVVSAVRMITEMSRVCKIGVSLSFALKSTAFALLSVSIVLYMVMIHKRDKKKENNEV